MQIQFIKTQGGEELVVLTRSDYEALLETAEEAEELAAACNGFRSLEEGAIPADVSKAIRCGLNPIAAWRSYLGITQAALAKTIGVTQPAIARLEKAKPGAGEAKTLDLIGKALSAPIWALKGHS